MFREIVIRHIYKTEWVNNYHLTKKVTIISCPIQKKSAGGVINILPGIKHWHGASPDEPMVHVAININTDKGLVHLMEPVTDEEYVAV